MFRTIAWCATVLSVPVLLASATHVGAADGKTYQVTGPVTDVSADSITVMKGKEKWTIARTAGTKTSGDIKAGDKVTVYYSMTATEIESKGATKKPGK